MEIENITYHPLKESLIQENSYRIIRPKNGVSYNINTSCRTVTTANNDAIPLSVGNSVCPGNIIEFEIKRSNHTEDFIDFKNSFLMFELTTTTSSNATKQGFRFQRGTGSLFNTVELRNYDNTSIEIINHYHMIQALYTAIGNNNSPDYENGVGFTMGPNMEIGSTINTLGSLAFGVVDTAEATSAILTSVNKQLKFATTTNRTSTSTFIHKFNSSLFGKYADKWIPINKSKGFRLLLTLNNFEGAFQNLANTQPYSIYNIKIKPLLYLKTYNVKKELTTNILQTSAVRGEIVIPFKCIKTFITLINLNDGINYEIDLPLYVKNLKSVLFGFNDHVTYNRAYTANVTNAGNHSGATDDDFNPFAYAYQSNMIGCFKSFYTNNHGDAAFSLSRYGDPAAFLKSYGCYINNRNIDEIDRKTNIEGGYDKSDGTYLLQLTLLKDALYVNNSKKTILGCDYSELSMSNITLQQLLDMTILETNIDNIIANDPIGNSPFYYNTPYVTTNFDNIYGIRVQDVDGSNPPTVKLKLNFYIVNAAYLKPQHLTVFLICDNHYYLNLDTGESRTEF